MVSPGFNHKGVNCLFYLISLVYTFPQFPEKKIIDSGIVINIFITIISIIIRVTIKSIKVKFKEWGNLTD